MWCAAVQVAVEEVRRLQRFGVTAGELDRYRQALLRDSEQAAEQADSVPSSDTLDFIMESLALGHTVITQREACLRKQKPYRAHRPCPGPWQCRVRQGCSRQKPYQGISSARHATSKLHRLHPAPLVSFATSMHVRAVRLASADMSPCDIACHSAARASETMLG